MEHLHQKKELSNDVTLDVPLKDGPVPRLQPQQKCPVNESASKAFKRRSEPEFSPLQNKRKAEQRQGVCAFDMCAKVISPSGVSEDATIADLDDDFSTFSVHFVPKEVGLHTVSVRVKDMHIPVTNVGKKCKLTFKLPVIPLEADEHLINAKCLGRPIQGSPFKKNVLEQETKVEVIDVVDYLKQGGTTNEYEIDTSEAGARAFDLHAYADLEDSTLSVHFVPKEGGVHTVSVRKKDLSPFQCTVGPFRDRGAHRVDAGGPGLIRGNINEPCKFLVSTREAGAGGFAVSVEGPSKAGIVFKEDLFGYCFVTYKVTEPGDYRVGIEINEQHIPGSPFHVCIMPPAGDANKIEIGQFPHNARVNKLATLSILMNGAKGNIDAKVITPSGAEDDCFLVNLDSDEWALKFVPTESGVHLIHIRLEGVHIPESPVAMRIGVGEADPAAVQVYGQSLKEAKTDKDTRVVVFDPKFRATQIGLRVKQILLKVDSSLALEDIKKKVTEEVTSIDYIFQLYIDAMKMDANKKRDTLLYCCNVLKNSLTVQNFAKTLKLCCDYPDSNFLNIVAKFLLEHLDEILFNACYQKLKRADPAAETVVFVTVGRIKKQAC